MSATKPQTEKTQRTPSRINDKENLHLSTLYANCTKSKIFLSLERSQREKVLTSREEQRYKLLPTSQKPHKQEQHKVKYLVLREKNLTNLEG